jgi:hypothetical protein
MSEGNPCKAAVNQFGSSIVLNFDTGSGMPLPVSEAKVQLI